METASLDPPAAPRRVATLAVLGFLYTAQGIPFGVAAEYLPVVLRRAHFSRAAIAAVFWLQLPWMLKVLWAGLPDRPAVRARGQRVLLALQLALATLLALYAPFELRTHRALWFALTALCALVAAVQDVFVDAFAVRSLAPPDRGLGNIAQVAGYRLGMLAGGAGLLVLSDSLGAPRSLLALAALCVAAGALAFALRAPEVTAAATQESPRSARPLGLRDALAHVFARACVPVLALAATYKLGSHIASSLIKPMVVDAHWSSARIGWAVVTVGTAAAMAGSLAGGFGYRYLRETRALAAGMALHALACAPLVAASLAHAPFALTTAAIALEHFATGAGTTVLFAALMTATRPSSAGMHYTVLTSANALFTGLGAVAGGAMADASEPATYALAGVLALAPLALLPRWERAARASSMEPGAA